MTQHSTSEIRGWAEGLMRRPLSPAEFAQAVRVVCADCSREEAHRRLDVLVTGLLACLGYGEAMAVFFDIVSECHTPARPA